MKIQCSVLAVVLFSAVLLISAGCQQQTAEPEKPPLATKMAESERPVIAPKIAEKKPQTPETEPAKAFPVITFEKTVHDFGEIEPGSKLNCEFTFKNTGNALLKIGKIRASCGCTALKLDKKDYAPGQSGTLKVRYTSSKSPGKKVKSIFVPSNDPKKPEVKLTVKAQVMLKVSLTPTTLNLSLRKPNAGCPQLTLTSVDGEPFSIKSFKSPQNCITADFNPGEKATKFVLQPKVDIEKLSEKLRGAITIQITHPKIKRLTVSYSAPPDFKIQPGTFYLQNAVPNKPVKREVVIRSNYGEDFRIESTSCKQKQGFVKVLSQQKMGKGFKLNVEITPPEPPAEVAFSKDTFYINIENGPKLEVPCYVFYTKKPSQAPTVREGTRSPARK